jgi:hypothetical protein
MKTHGKFEFTDRGAAMFLALLMQQGRSIRYHRDGLLEVGCPGVEGGGCYVSEKSHLREQVSVILNQMVKNYSHLEALMSEFSTQISQLSGLSGED